jgi:YHS domain-containing protein
MCCCSKSNKDPMNTTRTTVEPTSPPTTDPVCGMTVDPANAPSVENGGTKFYFCCQGCAARFRGDPAQYLQRKQAAH